ncbi:PREDICTED: retinol dehydrogenase 12-like isoform X2 [Nicrophorus vespilloides]|uniref:Retinol dehydrogenase 12-like isoform X2 n=1 Tax=Nicrophorus vespilloides TaxID=110193 RepID=A0ABM1M3L7_NICVS|nr:PREDICTED: retinol dehydrogenase 12-like isoform X2 [Nicrophorus vespilloides]
MFHIYVFIAVVLFFKLYLFCIRRSCKSYRCLVGKTALITGGYSGIGFATAVDLAKRGCKVIIADIMNPMESAERVKHLTGNPNVYGLPIDLSSLKSVRKFSKILHNIEEKIDILINNAGACGFNGQFTNDELQKTMQINHLGGFLLIHLVLDMLKKAEKARIVSVSSIYSFLHNMKSHNEINKPPSTFDKKLTTIVDYGNSKLCVIAACNVMSKKLVKYNITCNTLCPGLVWTSIHYDSFKAIPNKSVIDKFLFFTFYLSWIWFYSKTVMQGAQTSINCVVSEKLDSVTGQFFRNCEPSRQPRLVQDPDFCQNVYKESEVLCGLTSDEKIS